jgi:hypothetical protein
MNLYTISLPWYARPTNTPLGWSILDATAMQPAFVFYWQFFSKNDFFLKKKLKIK